MTTHQELAGMSDDEFVRRQTVRYAIRFNEHFWDFFAEHVEVRLMAEPTIVDVGCGPGLFLRDVSRRHPDAVLHGVDVTPAMLDAAGKLDYAGLPPDFHLCDAAREPLPLDGDSVELLSTAATMHLFDDPFRFLKEVRRVLQPGGMFLLFDWVRVPFRQYLLERQKEPTESSEDPWTRSLKLFAAHNKFTANDWRWLLEESGLDVLAETDRPHQRAHVFLCGSRWG